MFTLPEGFGQDGFVGAAADRTGGFDVITLGNIECSEGAIPVETGHGRPALQEKRVDGDLRHTGIFNGFHDQAPCDVLRVMPAARKDLWGSRVAGVLPGKTSIKYTLVGVSERMLLNRRKFCSRMAVVPTGSAVLAFLRT